MSRRSGALIAPKNLILFGNANNIGICHCRILINLAVNVALIVSW